MKTSVKWKRELLPVVLGLALGLSAPSAWAQAPAPGDGVLQPGDVVQVTVWQRDELSGEFTVTQDGSLTHPLYRQVRVTGIPVSQVEDRIRSFLSQYEANPQIFVQPLYHVAISGAVFRPDIYAVPPGTTVDQVVTRAGGVVEGGERDDVVLIRNGRETDLDLTRAEAMQMVVLSGDQILVKTEGSGLSFRSTVLPALHIATTLYSIIRISNR